MMRAVLVLAVALLAFSGCATTRTFTAISADSILAMQHRTLHVVTKDAKPIVLSEASVVGDSLVGSFESIDLPYSLPIARGSRYAIALADIDRIETFKSKSDKTLVYVLVVGLVIASTAILVGIAQGLSDAHL
jgi:hypothetical protein